MSDDLQDTLRDRTARLESIRALPEASQRALFSAHVAVLIEGCELRTRTTWTLLETLLELVSRTVRRTSVVVTGIAAEADLQRLTLLCNRMTTEEAEQARMVEPAGDVPPSAAVVIGIGTAAGVRVRPNFWLGYDGWCARVSDKGAPMLDATDLPWGALAAAALGAARVLRLLIGHIVEDEAARLFGDLEPEVELDLWSLQWRKESEAAPGGPPHLQAELGAVDVIGAGAIAHGLAWGLLHADTITGDFRWWDEKLSTPTGRNRNLLQGPNDARPKVAALADALRKRGIGVEAIVRNWTPDDSLRETVVSTVDSNRVRRLLQRALPPLLLNGGTSDSEFMVSSHLRRDIGTRACLECLAPNRADEELTPQISLQALAERLGVPEAAVASGVLAGRRSLTPEQARQWSDLVPEAAELLQRAVRTNEDLCGVFGGLRSLLGVVSVPPAASVGFSSFFAGLFILLDLAKRSAATDDRKPVVISNAVTFDPIVSVKRQVAQWHTPRSPRRTCRLCSSPTFRVA